MTVVAVTGASGTAGRAAIRALVEAGHDVRATDRVPPREDLGVPFRTAELTDYGETVEVLDGAEAVVHMAGIPSGHLTTPTRVLHNNTVLSNNVLLAAAHLGVGRVVWASSETLLGVLFTPQSPPRYVPMDDDHVPYPKMTYALSKLLTEVAAEHVAAWSEMTIIGLRFSHVRDLASYGSLPSFWRDPSVGQFNLWSYVDVRDVAASVLAALGANLSGSHNMLIAAGDTVMDRPSRDLLAKVFPDVEIRQEIDGFKSLIDSSRARELIGYVPRYSWRDHLEPDRS